MTDRQSPPNVILVFRGVPDTQLAPCVHAVRVSGVKPRILWIDDVRAEELRDAIAQNQGLDFTVLMAIVTKSGMRHDSVRRGVVWALLQKLGLRSSEVAYALALRHGDDRHHSLVTCFDMFGVTMGLSVESPLSGPALASRARSLV